MRAAAGVQYGPAFRRVLRGDRNDTIIEVDLSPVEESAGLSSRKQILHPIGLDATFHALFENMKRRLDERLCLSAGAFRSTTGRS